MAIKGWLDRPLIRESIMTISENANKAAQWWTDQLKSSSVKHDNGTNYPNALALLAFYGPRSKDYTGEQLDSFRSHLANHIESEIKEWGDCLISTDYDPDDTLRKAAEQSGMKLSIHTVRWRCGQASTCTVR